MRKNNNRYPQGKGLEVFVKNGNVEGAIRKLKKKIAEDGLMKELKEREFYVKPSEKRAKAKAVGKARYEKMVKARQEKVGW